MSKIVEPKVSEVHKKLFHYTRHCGLMGILETQSLWSTRYNFLNDTTEFVHAKEALIAEASASLIKSIQLRQAKDEKFRRWVHESGGAHQLAADDAKLNSDTLYKVTGSEIYITSFTSTVENSYEEENGLLSQWRAYGSDGGYAIEFDTDRLEKLVQVEFSKYAHSNLIFASVVYGRNDPGYEMFLRPKLNNLAQNVVGMTDAIIEDRVHEYNTPETLYSDFTSLAARYKHPAFLEEKEVRICSHFHDKMTALSTLPPKEVMYRGKNNETAYIGLFSNNTRYTLADLTNENLSLPITRIIVGPHRDKEKRFDQLKDQLKNSGIKITKSETPFIGLQ